MPKNLAATVPFYTSPNCLLCCGELGHLMAITFDSVTLRILATQPYDGHPNAREFMVTSAVISLDDKFIWSLSAQVFFDMPVNSSSLILLHSVERGFRLQPQYAQSEIAGGDVQTMAGLTVMALAPNQRSLVVGDWIGGVRVFNAQTLKMQQAVVVVARRYISACSFSPCGAFVVCGSHDGSVCMLRHDDGSACAEDKGQRQQQHPLTLLRVLVGPGGDNVWCSSMSNSGRCLATGGSGGCVLAFWGLDDHEQKDDEEKGEVSPCTEIVFHKAPCPYQVRGISYVSPTTVLVLSHGSSMAVLSLPLGRSILDIEASAKDLSCVEMSVSHAESFDTDGKLFTRIFVSSKQSFGEGIRVFEYRE